MKPSQAALELHRVADRIDASSKPSTQLVAADLERVILALEGRTAWTLFKSKGEKKILGKIKVLEDLMRSTSKLVGVIRSGEDFSEIAKNAMFVKALMGASEFMNGSGHVIGILKAAESESEISEILHELDELYHEDDTSEESDKKEIVAALASFVKKSQERVKDLKDRIERHKSEHKKGEQIEEPKPQEQPPAKSKSKFFDRLRGKPAQE